MCNDVNSGIFMCMYFADDDKNIKYYLFITWFKLTLSHSQLV